MTLKSIANCNSRNSFNLLSQTNVFHTGTETMSGRRTVRFKHIADELGSCSSRNKLLFRGAIFGKTVCYHFYFLASIKMSIICFVITKHVLDNQSKHRVLAVPRGSTNRIVIWLLLIQRSQSRSQSPPQRTIMIAINRQSRAILISEVEVVDRWNVHRVKFPLRICHCPSLRSPIYKGIYLKSSERSPGSAED